MSEGKQFTIDQLIGVYVKVRDEKTALQATIKEKVAELTEKLGVLEAEILSRANEQGVESFKASSGTAFLSETSKANVADWDEFVHDVCKTAGEAIANSIEEGRGLEATAESFQNLIYEHFPIHFFTRSVVKTAVDEYIDEHDGLLPPGITLFVKKGVQVRRPTK